MSTETRVSRGLRIAGWIAVVFGVLTVVSGGRALFGGADAQAAVGDAVPFVLWFNFLSGFVYVLAGVGILLGRTWGAPLTYLLAIAIALVFLAFGWRVLSGGSYEMRTVGAMSLRLAFWIGLAVAVSRSKTSAVHR